MFGIGDLIVYGNTGVCRIVDITHRKLFDGEKKEFYVLHPLYQDCTISAPVNSDKVFMRPIISRHEAEELVDEIPSIQAEAYHNRVLRQLTEHYEEAFKTHKCADLIELTMSIYAKKKDMEKNNKRFGAVDEKYMKRAEELLFGELGAALHIHKDEVPAYIKARVGELDGRMG